MKIKPQGNRVLVELIDYSNETLELSQGYKEVQQFAKVIEVGTGVLTPDGSVPCDKPMIGDTVIITQTGGTMVSDGEKRYQIVIPDNIMGVIDEHSNERKDND